MAQRQTTRNLPALRRRRARSTSSLWRSDVVCPWCYIGHARMQSAIELAAAAGIETKVSFTPFILRRHLPKAGVDKFVSPQAADPPPLVI